MTWVISLCDSFGSVMEREVTFFSSAEFELMKKNGTIEIFIELFALSDG